MTQRLDHRLVDGALPAGPNSAFGPVRMLLESRRRTTPKARRRESTCIPQMSSFSRSYRLGQPGRNGKSAGDGHNPYNRYSFTRLRRLAARGEVERGLLARYLEPPPGTNIEWFSLSIRFHKDVIVMQSTPTLGLWIGLAWLLAAPLAAAEPAGTSAPAKPAELPLVFDEDMSSLPIERFKSLGPGGANWKKDSHWTIQAPAAFFRQVKAGRDAQLAVRMEFPRLKEGETSETRLGLVYQNNQVGVITFQRRREGEKTLGQIQMQRQPDIFGDLGVASRKLELKDDLPNGSWTFQIRAGAVTLTCDGKEIGRGTFETRTSPIFGFAIAQPSGAVTIQRMTLRASGSPAELSGQQREQAVAAATLNDEAGRLMRSKQHVEAMLKARQVVPLYEKLYGRDHHDVANALFNLGLVLKHGGELPESVKAFEEALAIRQRLFGLDHPDTAQIEMELTVVLVDLMRLEAAFPHCMAAHFSFVSYYGDDNRSAILSRQILDKLPRPKKEDET